MSNELWWRAGALEALKALILSSLISVRSVESGRLQRRLAAILLPSLTAILASPVLQVGRLWPTGSFRELHNFYDN